MTCSVTGTLVDPTGAALPDTPYRLARAGGIVGTGAGTVVPKIITGVSGTAAEFDEDLVAGNYLLTVYPATGQTYSVALPVPDEASAALSDLVTGGDAPQVAVWLTEARAAAAAAETAATAAEASAAAIQTYDSQAETSATSAAASATSAADSATSAADSATSAAASAASAATSATSAASAATSASESAASAAGSVDVVEAARDLVEADRAEVEANKNLTYGYAQDAASAVVYQNLASIAASKAVTAVDVFVYDTSKDSDGGAWRHRCAGTSWFNEPLNTATRGARREFPAVAVIVAEATKVTIYDGDDPALPMWMVFETLNKGIWITGLTGVVAKNAEIHFSGVGPSYFGWASVNLVSETFKFATNSGQRVLSNSVVQRNSTAVIISTDAAKAIVSSTVNDVAMAVLPNAPIDPATGLPVPTIYAFTDGGISQIGWDGVSANNVWDRVHSTFGYIRRGQALPSGGFVYACDNGGYSRYVHYVYNPLTSDQSIGAGYVGTNSDEFHHGVWTSAYADQDLRLLSQPTSLTFSLSGDAVGGVNGLNSLSRKPGDAAKGMVAYTTSTYNTGWMNGDIKGAFLASTDTTSLVGPTTDDDRSFNSVSLNVTGTITRSPVATGADLVAYSGFSASNFLEQPYNSALDFGTGNFCVMGWVKGNDTYCGLVDRGTGTAGFGGSFAVGGNATPKLFAKVGASTGYSSADVWSNTWRFVSLVRTGGVAYLYVDGAASGSFAAADSVTNASAITRIGLRTDGAAGFDGGGSLALWRISATAPTAEQIKKIYEDERKLFQPGAQCTLYGTSDAVTALAHDPKTNLLHVGTSAGRSTFDGLVRVANTTTPVATAISAVNGLIAEQ